MYIFWKYLHFVSFIDNAMVLVVKVSPRWKRIYIYILQSQNHYCWWPADGVVRSGYWPSWYSLQWCHNERSSAMASQVTAVPIVCSTVDSGTDQREHQSSASLAFVRGIHRWPVKSPHKRPVMREIFPFDDAVMEQVFSQYSVSGIKGVDVIYTMPVTWFLLALHFTVDILWRMCSSGMVRSCFHKCQVHNINWYIACYY